MVEWLKDPGHVDSHTLHKKGFGGHRAVSSLAFGWKHTTTCPFNN